MSIEKAIQKLKEEIKSKELIIKDIENFDKLDIGEQLQIIKESPLRYDKEFRESWVKRILNYKGYIQIESNSNEISVTYPMHTLSIPTYNYNGVIFDENVKIEEPIIPNDRNKKLFEIHLEASDNYKKIPSFKNFKRIMDLTRTGKKPLLWFWWIFNNTKAMKMAYDINQNANSSLFHINNDWKEYQKTLDTNTKIRLERERIEKELEKDFKIFEDNNLKVYKKY